ncbi:MULTISPECIES: DUF3558 domain-containing protein [Rhodococcus]|uniref:DUF3558 domain-containing protein n=1 Tax=Rhodococcus oxybenzonivorans TaxID=1990687 RepID=A0AAE5AA13_9NOCA|nr:MULTISPECIES: DUF3558 domain-containing protein [Rhodococcus]MDV7241334.1 DUF3558 domain-containing protein [Rhodococcus oxybenzonivorans]MDV7269136.1 DUF3558 domain-containing protein [Rhodococcus oxybenzonivorans]MDV7274133.1 DUF3558 domain-containing protein [Rhodococcus oxybenzonivorans]MDV7333614.1 DUF3558 domain-containing protein [Rhodococcus oxybenzonivorans]MDV7343034.1 DUF3558 domain-containing protein [Rhodococcus oxybenzonivorans]
MKLAALASAALTATLLSGCSEPHADSQTNSDTPTMTRVPRHIDKSDRPQVIFDPCLDIPDSALVQAGYDPQSESNADFTPDSYTFLGCGYDTQQRLYVMNVLSGNITFAEELEKKQGHSTPIDINGRRAILIFDPKVSDACDLSMETSYGVVGLTRSVFKGNGQHAPESEWCAGLEDTARIFEPFIPKGD